MIRRQSFRVVSSFGCISLRPIFERSVEQCGDDTYSICSAFPYAQLGQVRDVLVSEACISSTASSCDSTYVLSSRMNELPRGSRWTPRLLPGCDAASPMTIIARRPFRPDDNVDHPARLEVERCVLAAMMPASSRISTTAFESSRSRKAFRLADASRDVVVRFLGPGQGGGFDGSERAVD